MKKAIRILTTILVLSILAALYCILIAPLLEPASKYKKMETAGSDDIQTDSQIMTLFSPDDWEVNSYRHLNYKNIHVLAGDYKFLSPESISIDKCTIVFLDPDNSSKAIIVQCKGTIILNFEKSILHGFKDDNRILGGKLNGKIRVVSKGEENNVSFETQDFNIDKGRIWTNANVNFKYGRTQGVGSGMQIQLINRGLFGSKKERGSSPILDKIDNVTIYKLERLTIFPPVNAQNNIPKDQISLFSSPIELHCDGPFVFNALNNNATFEQNVSLIQTVSNRAPNSIRCQSLKLFFALPKRRVSKKKRNSKSKSVSQPTVNEWNLQLERLEAVGPLVVIEAPEYQTKIHTSRLTANLSPLSFELDSTNRQNEIHYKNCLISTQNLLYSVGENGRLGTMECNCPGWISAQMDQEGKQVRIRWSDRLRLEPDQKYHNENIVSIQGSARMELEKDNHSEASILADNIFFWISQKADASATGESDKLTVSRMHANKKVILKSNPITAQVKTLQLWFEDLGGKAQGGLDSGNIVNSPSGEPNKQNPSSDSPDAFSQLSAVSNNSYSVVGELLQGKILFGQGQPQISKLTLEKNVRVVQNNVSSNSDNGSGKLEMNGSQIQIFNLTLPSASASLIGEPAIIRYNNTLLTGSEININRGTNRIWIDSDGEAIFLGELPEEGEGGNSGNRQEAVDNRAQAAAWTPAKINWSESMEFQDDTLTFNGNVNLQKKFQSAQCDSMSIILNKKIDFQNLNSAELQNSIDVRFVVLNNRVRMENETDDNGVTVAVDCLTTSKLTINMKDQTFVADGPGRAMTQRRLGNKQEAGDNGEDSLAASLINMSVNFQKRLDGSFDTRSLQTFVFSGQVEAVYSPIAEIGKTVTTFKIEELPPQAFILQCDNMEIQADLGSGEAGIGSRQEAIVNSDSTAANSATRNSRLAANSAFIASGGVDLTGLTKDRLIYNANADKITYEGKNGMITLEGDGQRPAFISCQKIWNGRRSEASSSVIYYNTQTGAVRGEGIQEFSLFLSPKN